jgi:hypothetical protein
VLLVLWQPENTREVIPSCFQAFDFDSLDKSPFGERDRARSGDDEMVENSHVDQGQRLFLWEAVRNAKHRGEGLIRQASEVVSA